MEKNIKYYNALASLNSQHEIKLVNNKGVETFVTAKYILVAVGGRPIIPPELDSIREHILTSDDIFMKKTAPGKTLVIGASYVALECAGFLKALGYDTTVMVRSILLRGFDQDMAGRIGVYMQQEGTKFLMKTVVECGERLENGQIKMTYKNSDGVVASDVFDTVLVATGRFPDTKSLNCEGVCINLAKSGKIIVNEDESTSVNNIYAIGDVAEGKLELTPPAIKAGQLLAKRLFGGSKELMNYDLVATTVFTPIEYGACGLSEEDSIKKYGEDKLDIYHVHFKPLEWNYNEDRLADSCYTKLICNTQDKDRVVGIHYLGPHAGEVMQGYAVAMKMGVTYQDIHDTVGIHPTSSEEIVVLKIKKSEDPNAQKAGC